MAQAIPPFEVFYAAHRTEVLRVLAKRLGRDRADDAFQDTFLRALRAYPRLEHGDHLRAGVSLGPGRGDQLCVPVHTVWSSQQVDQRGPENPPRQSLSEHTYTV